MYLLEMKFKLHKTQRLQRVILAFATAACGLPLQAALTRGGKQKVVQTNCFVILDYKPVACFCQHKSVKTLYKFVYLVYTASKGGFYMPYAVMLDQLIRKSNLTVKEIAHKCQAEGANITASYISILRKPDNQRTPSEEVSHALEKVLGAPPNSLVVEAYMDTAPAIIRLAIRNFQKRTVLTMLMAAHAPLAETDTEELKATLDAEMEKMPYSEIITKLASEEINISDFEHLPITATGEQEGNQFNLTFNGVMGFKAGNNAMYPTIPQGSTIQIQMLPEYADGDIVAFCRKGNDTVECRQWSNPIKNVAVLTAFDPEYPPIKYDNEKILLMGKVISVTRTL